MVEFAQLDMGHLRREVLVTVGGPLWGVWLQIVCLFATGCGRQGGCQKKGRQAVVDNPS